MKCPNSATCVYKSIKYMSIYMFNFVNATKKRPKSTFWVCLT